MGAGPNPNRLYAYSMEVEPSQRVEVDGDTRQPNFRSPATQVSLTLISEITSGLTL